MAVKMFAIPGNPQEINRQAHVPMARKALGDHRYDKLVQSGFKPWEWFPTFPRSFPPLLDLMVAAFLQFFGDVSERSIRHDGHLKTLFRKFDQVPSRPWRFFVNQLWKHCDIRKSDEAFEYLMSEIEKRPRPVRYYPEEKSSAVEHVERYVTSNHGNATNHPMGSLDTDELGMNLDAAAMWAAYG